MLGIDILYLLIYSCNFFFFLLLFLYHYIIWINKLLFIYLFVYNQGSIAFVFTKNVTKEIFHLEQEIRNCIPYILSHKRYGSKLVSVENTITGDDFPFQNRFFFSSTLTYAQNTGTYSCYELPWLSSDVCTHVTYVHVVCRPVQMSLPCWPAIEIDSRARQAV